MKVKCCKCYRNIAGRNCIKFQFNFKVYFKRLEGIKNQCKAYISTTNKVFKIIIFQFQKNIKKIILHLCYKHLSFNLFYASKF